MSAEIPRASLTPESLIENCTFPLPIIDRLDSLVFSLENAYDCGDDALAEEYEAAIKHIYRLTKPTTTN